MRLWTVVGTIACLALAGAAQGREAQLHVGDAAPELDIETWVKGDEIALESGNVYVVEFWATWCVPCRKSIPHLSELQRAHRDDGLTIIGVSSEELDKVRPFVKRQGAKMDYTVAVDRRSGTKRSWFSAAGLEGIPAAFIVDREGKIAWIGNPLDERFDPTLKRVIKGRYNPSLEREAAPQLKAARSARTVRNWRLATKHYDDVIELDPRVFADVALERFEMMLVDMHDTPQAYEYAANQLVKDRFAGDAEALQMLATKIVTDPKIDDEARDMDLALEAVQASQRLAGSRNATALAALAMVRFHRGEIDEAVDAQKQAYFVASRKSKAEHRRLLRTYQEAAQRASR